MASTFFGLHIGGSALAAYQAAVNTTANNIANVQTEGYSRQETTLSASAPLRVNARYGSTGTGVEAIAITQQRDLYYDTKYWGNNSSLGLYEQKLYYLEQIEENLKDDTTQKGFATIFANLFNSLDTLKTNSSDESVRNQFINQAQVLCTYFNSLSSSFTSVQEDCNEEIKSQVKNINAISQKVAMLNKEINSIEITGSYANELRDERAKLLDELSKIVSVETVENDVVNTYGDNLGATNFTVIINGQVLVDGNEYRTIDCVSQTYSNNQNDIDGLYSLVWSDTGMDFAATTTSASGSLKALFELRDGNNGISLTGTISAADEGHITLSGPNITNLNELDIATKGRLTINSKYYIYDGWSAEVDKDGNIVSYTFNLSEPIDPALADNMVDRSIECGHAVTGMGIPYYKEQMNEFLRNFMQMFNDIEKSGVDLNGNEMGAFFVAQNKTGSEYGFNDWEKDEDGNLITGITQEGETYTITSGSDIYYQLTAANVAVNSKSVKDPSYFATATEVDNGQDKYDLCDELLNLESGVNLFRGDNASQFLETLLSDVSVDTQRADIFRQTYSNLEVAISNQRTSVSGVDEDEEALNLIKFQNAYNLASKMISVMSEMYDKLINETGIA